MSVLCRILMAVLAGGCLLVVQTATAQVILRANPQTVIIKPNATNGPRVADKTLGVALLGVVFNSDGTLARGSGVTSSSHPLTGLYVVDFDRDIANCIYSAAIVLFGTVSIVRIVAVSNNKLQFNTNRTSDGALSDAGFSATVYCPK